MVVLAGMLVVLLFALVVVYIDHRKNLKTRHVR
jgi:hypothetical protein